MTFASAWACSVMRSVVVALVGVGLAALVARLPDGVRGRWRNVVWALILAPLFSPGLVVGYAYRNYSLSLVHHPAWNEVLYAAIVLAQAVPVGVLLLRFAPAAPLSRAGAFLLALGDNGRSTGDSLRSSPGHSLSARWHMQLAAWRLGEKRAWLPAAALMFLVSFQESEIASLMQAKGWTEWLFTRQAGMVNPAEVLRDVLGVVATELVVLIPAALWLWNLEAAEKPSPALQSRSGRAAAGVYLLAACVLNLAVPWAYVGVNAWEGAAILGRQQAFYRELANGVLFAGTAALCAAGGAAWWIGRWRRAGIANLKLGRGLLALLVVPGLMGGLALGVLLASLFQLPGLNRAYDTPAPLLLGLTLYLLPRAVLVTMCLGVTGGRAPLHIAGLLSGGDGAQQAMAAKLRWEARGRQVLLAVGITFLWSYLELMLPSLLAPTGMEPAVKLLYNLMHFGHIAGLSALVAVTVAVPAAILGLALAAGHLWYRVQPHSPGNIHS